MNDNYYKNYSIKKEIKIINLNKYKIEIKY